MAQTAEDATVEWLKCAADPAYFINTYCIIDEPQGDGYSLIPFHLWPEQMDFIYTLLDERRVVTLKARQLGITWLCCAYALWICLFQAGRMVLAFSQGQNEADEMIRRVRAMWERLPEWFYAYLPTTGRPKTSEIEWSNGSRMESFPATRRAGRSFTASLVLMDEIAFMDWADELYTAVTPTIDNGGQLIVFSTANGEGTLHYRLYMGAQAGENGYKAIFLPWWVRPGRDAAWYARTELAAVSTAKMKQEYPATPEEAFAVSGAERYLPDMLYWDACEGPLPPLTNANRLYLAADAGVSGDHFALVGVTRHPTRVEDAVLRYARTWVPPRNGKIDFGEVEAEIRRLCKMFNVALLTYDPYQLHDMMTRLKQGRVVVVSEFSQGKERAAADKHLLDLILRKGIVHDGNPTMREHLNNANREVDAKEKSLRIVKRTGALKVDLVVTLGMAAYRCLKPILPEEKPKQPAWAQRAIG